jgi:4-amino-4-deoxy-L-arabinose transferase-like glycosyltransferase
MYIGAARNLLSGHGLTIAWSTTAGTPLTHYPPMFPFALALLGITGLDPWEAARYLNAALRSADLLLVALLAKRAGAGSPWAALIAAFLMLTSVHMEFVHGSAWSEPLFFVLTLLSLALVARYLANGSRLALLGAGVLVAGAVLTRYAGLTLVLTIVLALLWWRKPRAILMFVSVACVPPALWVLRNALLGGMLVGDRGIAWHGLSVQQLGQALFSAVDWVLPSSLGSQLVSPDGDVRGLGIAGLVTVGAGLGWYGWKQRGWLTSRDVDEEADLLSRLLGVFAVMYPAGIVVSMLAFDDLVQLDTRILSPTFVSLLILFSAGAPRALSRVWRAAWLRAPVVLGIVGLAAGYAIRFGVLASTIHADGVMYSNAGWITSPTMEWVRTLPSDATVFSNAPDAVYMLAGLSAYEIPNVAHADRFAGVLQDALRTSGGPVALVYFADPNIAYRRPVPVEQVQQWVPTRPAVMLSDGKAYQVSP